MSSPRSSNSSMSSHVPRGYRYKQQTQPATLNPPNNNMLHVNGKGGTGNESIENLLSTQVSLRRDVMRHDESVQAVRQENIKLAEKVQQASTLYRQLLSRVSKTEERIEVENKSMSNILMQAKQVETQLVNQNERLNNKEAQLEIQVQKLQEEMSIMKVEREQMRKSNNNINQELRQIQEKLARQSGILSSGLQELKAHLDQKDVEKTQSFHLLFNELREKIETQEHQKSMFHTQIEGRLETLKLQCSQNEKTRQDDVYQLQTTIREKEALSKAEVRRLQEKFRDVFDEFSKSIAQKDSKLRQDLELKVDHAEKKLSSDAKNLERKFREMEDENNKIIQELKKELNEQFERFKSKNIPDKPVSNVEGQIEYELKQLDKQIKQNKQDIEKVVRAEIQSRLSQGEKLSRQVNEIHKDNNEGFQMIQDTLADHKRKQSVAIETTRKDLTRMLNDQIKTDVVDEKRVELIEKKIEDIEDALDEFAKQEERIDMNSERVKSMEMENILALGDLQSVIETNTKRIQKSEQTCDDKIEEVVRQMERDKNKTPRPSTAVTQLKAQLTQLVNKWDTMPSQIKLVEKKLHYLAEGFEDYKKQEKSMSNAKLLNDFLTSRRNQTPLPVKREKIEKLDIRLKNMKEVMNVLKDVLTEKINDEHFKDKRNPLLQRLKKILDELNMLKISDEDEMMSSEEDEEDSEDSDKMDAFESKVNNPSKNKSKSNKKNAEEEEESEDEDDDKEVESEDEDDDDGQDEDEEDDDDDEDDEEDDGDEEDDDEEDDDRPKSSRSSVLELALSRESTMDQTSPNKELAPPKGQEKRNKVKKR